MRTVVGVIGAIAPNLVRGDLAAMDKRQESFARLRIALTCALDGHQRGQALGVGDPLRDVCLRCGERLDATAATPASTTSA